MKLGVNDKLMRWLVSWGLDKKCVFLLMANFWMCLIFYSPDFTSIGTRNLDDQGIGPLVPVSHLKAVVNG